MQEIRNATHIIRWRQFAHKGYAAFASLHKVICIGVLSVSTLSVAAKAQASLSPSSRGKISVPLSSEETEVGKELSELTVSASMAPLTQLQAARIVCVLSRQDIEQAAAQSVNDLLKFL